MKTEKVKIFTANAYDKKYFQELEDEINEWLNKNSGKIKIICRCVTGAGGASSSVPGGNWLINCTVTFFYTDIMN